MWRRTRTPTDFKAEIEAHLELEAERLREEGLIEARARAAARRAFGNVANEACVVATVSTVGNPSSQKITVLGLFCAMAEIAKRSNVTQ